MYSVEIIVCVEIGLIEGNLVRNDSVIVFDLGNRGSKFLENFMVCFIEFNIILFVSLKEQEVKICRLMFRLVVVVYSLFVDFIMVLRKLFFFLKIQRKNDCIKENDKFYRVRIFSM